MAKKSPNSPSASPGGLGEQVGCPPGLEHLAETLHLMELHLFVQSGLAADADAVLAPLGYGRAHHRTLYFVARQPGISPTQLTAVFGISNQALSKVMVSLLADRLVEQVADSKDRRVKRCYATDRGLQLLEQVFSAQSRRVERAIAATSRDDLIGHIRLYSAMVGKDVQLIDPATVL
jgi:DNA-binding MarR family transcriptional regulator